MPCCKNKKEKRPDPFKDKMLMRRCQPQKPHPCDPKLPCGVCDEEEPCPRQTLCVERIKNPYLPSETRCKPGNFLPANLCIDQVPHPCDPPPPCKPGRQKGKPCKTALCKERIKNIEDPFLRCPDPDDIYSHDICENLDEIKTPVPQCSTADPCAPSKLKDPFEDKVKFPDKYVPKPDPNEYLYSRELCKNLEMLKEKIINCFTPHPCDPPILKDPFEDVPPKYPEVKDPCDIDPKEERKKRRGK